MRGFHYLLIAFAACAIGFMPTETGAVIYVCTDENGHRTYTDLGCPHAAPYTPPPAPPVSFAPLDATEAARLEALRKRVEDAGREQRDAARRRRIAATSDAAERKAACARAKAALSRLVERRRRGYALSQQRGLDEQEAVLKDEKRRFCGA